MRQPTEAEIREGALGILRVMEQQAEDEDARQEQVIVVCDPKLGREHAIGVYANREAALAGLEAERANYLKADPEFDNLQYKIIPMFRGLHEEGK